MARQDSSSVMEKFLINRLEMVPFGQKYRVRGENPCLLRGKF
jgi:hypothetical protein